MSIGELARGAACASMAFESLGIKLTVPVTVRRIDLAAELHFVDGLEGLAFLNACERGLHLSKLRQVPYHATGDARLESIVWQTTKGKKTKIKLYDAGFHHGTNPPGQRLRLERELRYAGQKSPTLEQAVALDLATEYGKPITPWLTRAPQVRVSVPMVAVQLLYEQARNGERTRRKAESLGAKVNSLAFGSDLLAPHDRRRRIKDLRDAGIVLDLSWDPHSRLTDLGPPLRALAALWGPRAKIEKRVEYRSATPTEQERATYDRNGHRVRQRGAHDADASALTPRTRLLPDASAELPQDESPRGELVDAAAVADALGVSRDFVYAHATELGGHRIGNGSRGRLRFDLAYVFEAWTSRSTSKESHRQKTPVPVDNSGGRRRQRMGSDTELLPIRGSAVAADADGERS
jgi:hypothetical protein